MPNAPSKIMLNRCCATELAITSFIVKTSRTGSSGSTSWTALVVADAMPPWLFAVRTTKVMERAPLTCKTFANLARWHVQGRRGSCLIESVNLHIADNADNFAHDTGKECHRQTLTDGVLAGPEFSCHRLADQNDGRSAGNVRVIEVASSHNRDSHGLHIAGAGQANIDLGLVSHRLCR